MRVALFFDGKNHTKDQRRAATDRWVDHGMLAKFAVDHVGGTEMAFAWYYTGVPSEDVRDDGTSFVTIRRGRNDDQDGPTSHSLSSLLDELERKPGFFVKRFPRRPASRECPVCGQASAYTEEKMVDTSLVADLVLQAARGTFDVAVVFSGDVDIAPGIQAVHDLGKRCWVATYGTASLSRQLTRVAWSSIDLLNHLDAFSTPDLIAPRSASSARPQLRDPAEVTPAGRRDGGHARRAGRRRRGHPRAAPRDRALRARRRVRRRALLRAPLEGQGHPREPRAAPGVAPAPDDRGPRRHVRGRRQERAPGGPAGPERGGGAGAARGAGGGRHDDADG